MVEFIRDVIVVVAILVTLIALAFHPAADKDAGKSTEQLNNRISASGSIKPAAEPLVVKGTTAVSLAK